MHPKVFVLLATVAFSRAAIIASPGPVAAVAAIGADFDPSPQYSYAYDVQDAITGDNKSQQESRSGDSVQGSYSIVESDGSRRTVEYTSNPETGFNAIVHREPPGAAKAAAPAVAVASPIYGKTYIG